MFDTQEITSVDLRGGGVTGVRYPAPPPKRDTDCSQKGVYRRFTGSSLIKNWINDNLPGTLPRTETPHFPNKVTPVRSCPDEKMVYM